MSGKRDLIITVFSKFKEVHISFLTLLEDDYEGRKSLPVLIKVQSIQFFLGVICVCVAVPIWRQKCSREGPGDKLAFFV